MVRGASDSVQSGKSLFSADGFHHMSKKWAGPLIRKERSPGEQDFNTLSAFCLFYSSESCDMDKGEKSLRN
jgi:hypothetical protein